MKSRSLARARAIRWRHLAAATLLAVLAFAFARAASHSEARSLSNDPAPQSHAVSAGGYHSCGLRTDGILSCWGDDLWGQATPPAGTFTRVSAGSLHTCGVRTDGTLACWGDNSWGQATPLAGTFTQVSAGGYHTCGVMTNGTPACWGDNSQGQATPLAGTFSQVSAGGAHTCGVMTNSALACWGANGAAQATPPGGTFSQVSAGYFHTCGVMTDGTLTCWGDNGAGQAAPPGGTFTQVSAGAWHTCGVRTDGTLACWGDDTWGQATPPGGTFTQVSAGGEHTCGVMTDGTIACWGNNGYGQTAFPAGTIIIVKATEPPGGAGFGFTDNIAAPNSFSLNHAGTRTFSNAFTDSYTVVEDDPQVTPGGFALTGLICIDLDGGSRVDLGARKATIDLDEGETVYCIFVNTSVCVFPDDADCDACWDASEPTLSPPADPADPWDWYDVPVPTLFSGGHISGDPTGTDDRDHAVSIIDDLLAVLEYAGCEDGGLPNAAGRQYNQDINSDGVDDGQAYDRSVGATRSGAPNGAITIIDDVLLLLAQAGHSCGPTPP